MGERTYEINYFQYKGSNDGDEGALIILRDITEEEIQKNRQKALEKQLFNSQKMEAIGILTAGIAHDFNNILTSILGYAELGLRFGTMDDNTHSYLETIEQGGKRGKDLIEKMLAYSRNSTSATSLQEPLQLIEKAVNLVMPALREKVPVNINREENIPKINLDPVEFEQVIINLCLNARDAMEGHGTIEIAFNCRTLNRECHSCHENIFGTFLDITLKDSGHGIPEKVISKIFDPFYTTKKEGEGTGLGLSMVHGIIHNTGGHIYIDSSPEKGTMFHLLFPIPSQAEIQSAIQANAPEQIMVVDDDVMVGSYLREILLRNGFEPVYFSKSSDALAHFQTHQENISLVITDQVMPGLTGIELSEEILMLDPSMPIIILTGYSKDLTEQKAKDKGIREFFGKPIDKEKLLASIRQLIDSK